jgi:hypothetical protein
MARVIISSVPIRSARHHRFHLRLSCSADKFRVCTSTLDFSATTSISFFFLLSHIYPLHCSPLQSPTARRYRGVCFPLFLNSSSPELSFPSTPVFARLRVIIIIIIIIIDKVQQVCVTINTYSALAVRTSRCEQVGTCSSERFTFTSLP